jgi:hypothetical protein
LLAVWKTVCTMAMNGAVRNSKAVASQPRCGSEGHSPTAAIPSRRTPWPHMATWVERRMPSQSVTVPEKNRKMVVAVVKRATA